jgi:xanthine dehydrogenase accessory factor
MAKPFNWIQRIAELEKAGKPFAIATVIDTVAPTSAKPMAKAIINVDGKLEGWIGGGCSQDIIIEEALKCINTGKSVLIRLSPNELNDETHSFKKNFLMACESEGTLEFHLEPVLPMKKMLIYGTTPSAETLANMGKLLNYDIVVMGNNADKLSLLDGINTRNEFESIDGASYAIVATQGKGDMRSIRLAIASDPDYLALIASKRKGDKLMNRLLKKGTNKNDLKKIKYPAGLNIGAVTPQEIATSIMAEIIQVSIPDLEEETIVDFMQVKEGQEKDPICGMGVDTKNAEHLTEYKGEKYYFCCSGCLEKFESEPAVYV